MILVARANYQIRFETCLRVLKSIGFGHIRFDIKNIPEQFKDRSFEIFSKYQDLVEQAGLRFGEFHCFASSDIDGFERLALFYLKLMKQCGAKYLSQHLNPELLKHAGRLNRIIKKFKQAGIYFCVENGLYFPPDIKTMEGIIDLLPEASVAFDIGHAFMNRVNPEEFYDRFKYRIKVIHLHDFVNSDHEIPFTGKLLQMPSFAEKLRGFDECIVLEIRAYTPDMCEQRYRKSFENTKKFLLV